MAHDVFISYSQKDKPAADATCATLEADGIRCWMAPRDISPGAEWGEAIIDAINSALVMVLIFSSNANESRQVRREVEHAVTQGVTIMPVRIELVDPARSLAYFMAGVHWLDAITPPFEEHLRRLAASIKAILEAGRRGYAAKEATREAQGPPGRWPVRKLTMFAIATAALLFVCVLVLPSIFGVPNAYKSNLPGTTNGDNFVRPEHSAGIELSPQSIVTSGGADTFVENYVFIDKFCSSEAIQIVVDEGPQNGHLSVRDEMVVVPGYALHGSTGACAGKFVAGKSVYYQSFPNFRGTDRLVYVVSAVGGSDKHTINITVR